MHRIRLPRASGACRPAKRALSGAIETMTKHRLHVRRLPQRLTGDASRTILRFFWLGSTERACRVMDRVLSLGDREAFALLKTTLGEFRRPHPHLQDTLIEHFHEAVALSGESIAASRERELLIGAYFTMEYAFESTALCNPSMVPVRDQSGLAPGSLRVLISLRAVGEGHVSSIVYRSAVLTRDCDVIIDPPEPSVRAARAVENPVYDKGTFREKLTEMGGDDPVPFPETGGIRAGSLDHARHFVAEDRPGREMSELVQIGPADSYGDHAQERAAWRSPRYADAGRADRSVPCQNGCQHLFHPMHYSTNSGSDRGENLLYIFLCDERPLLRFK